MEGKRIEDADFNETGYSYTLSLISGKYKPVILYCLMEYEPVRFNEMQRYLQKVADKTLSQNLKEIQTLPNSHKIKEDKDNYILFTIAATKKGFVNEYGIITATVFQE